MISKFYLSLSVRNGKRLKKIELRNALMTLKRFSIVEFDNVNEIMTDEVPLIIMDTILMAVPLKDIREAKAMLERYQKNSIEKSD